MRTGLPLWIASLGLLAVFASASATTVTDTYSGADGHGRGDVISGAGVTTYNVSGMDAVRSGNQLTIVIYTNFAGHAGIETQWTRNSTGIGYGDLFLSTGWDPHGSSPYGSDNAANGNHWTYAFVLDNPLDNTGGNGTIYALPDSRNSNHNPGVQLSDHFIDCSGCTYRNGQAVAVKTSKATATDNTGIWSVGDGFLSFSFDTTGLDLDLDSFGFHWTMYCGNDVIEGLGQATAVPEPGPLGLFLLGTCLMGLGVVRRRKNAKVMGPAQG